jgi:hypothetical protein
MEKVAAMTRFEPWVRQVLQELRESRSLRGTLRLPDYLGIDYSLAS